MTQAPPRRLIVKIAMDGTLYVDFRLATLDQLGVAVRQLNADGGIVVYYRESPFETGSDAAAAVFTQLAALKPRVLMGNKAPSEWGRLDWVEVQRNPQLSRVFVARGQQFLVYPEATDGAKPTVLMGGPLSGEAEDALLKNIDFLVRTDRLIETPPRAAQLAMDEATSRQPSLHVRIGYQTRRWAAVFPEGEAPSNIEAFYRDLWVLMKRSFRGLPA
jgi:hypothetical protein